MRKGTAPREWESNSKLDFSRCCQDVKINGIIHQDFKHEISYLTANFTFIFFNNFLKNMFILDYNNTLFFTLLTLLCIWKILC